MMGADIILLAPGPSMSQELAASFLGRRVGVVGNCWELAPWAEFLVANDKAWWQAYPAAQQFEGRKFSANRIPGVEMVDGMASIHNSGVLALEVAARLGARSIELHGYDMRGSHYFGPYENGLTNTGEKRRERQLAQFQAWATSHPGIRVINRTPHSALTCFPLD